MIVSHVKLDTSPSYFLHAMMKNWEALWDKATTHLEKMVSGVFYHGWLVDKLCLKSNNNIIIRTLTNFVQVGLIWCVCVWVTIWGLGAVLLSCLPDGDYNMLSCKSFPIVSFSSTAPMIVCYFYITCNSKSWKEFTRIFNFLVDYRHYIT